MRQILVIAISLMLTPGLVLAGTTIVGGNLPGSGQTWTPAGSPYLILGDTTVPAGAFLTIQAGTQVQFASNIDGQSTGLNATRVELTINGTLNINGTAASPVILNGQNSSTSGNWFGIVVGQTATSVVINHANISGPIYGIYSSAAGNVLQVASSTISSAQSAGINVLAGTPTLDAVSIGPGQIGINYNGNSGGTVSNSLIGGNSYGIYYEPTAGSPSLLITQSTLHGNTYGVLMASGGTGTVFSLLLNNSLITQSSNTGVYRDTFVAAASTVSVTYSDVFNNATNYQHVVAGVGSISADPLYIAAPGDLHLRAGSPAIDSGSASNSSAHDRDGNPRPLNGGSGTASYDMGAYEAADGIFINGFD
ncbi:hypothetical protein ELE36_10565 [Pseudolysobacter antarcticus]|uniref:Right-handed parallel beta-helix repeat-containing protein n=1 Tax=Pseudolysobacter antarcticus TaxID=2511995 RepID=A0A411HJQ6_9GAMM|nr:choice-of-anchor Q domain-containing protein [Pseudolysobacter antarcticus]QBB70762.1 hypothetical protein ELE36_10565 [Pseudolysobacter antarcticus]